MAAIGGYTKGSASVMWGKLRKRIFETDASAATPESAKGKGGKKRKADGEEGTPVKAKKGGKKGGKKVRD